MLVFVKYLLIFLMLCCVLWLLYKTAKRGHFFKTYLFSAALGILALLSVWGIGKFTSPALTVNLWTVSCAGVLGIPGVILMILTKILWAI